MFLKAVGTNEFGVLEDLASSVGFYPLDIS